MIVRKIERCPKCGQIDPWRKYKTATVNGECRRYVKCKRCGKRETMVWRDLA